MPTKRAAPWQMVKKERLKLDRLIRDWVLERGGVDHGRDERGRLGNGPLCYQYEIETKAGPFVIRVDTDDGSIFGRFIANDLSVATSLFQSRFQQPNPYTGKLNHHPGKATARETFDYYLFLLGPAL